MNQVGIREQSHLRHIYMNWKNFFWVNEKKYVKKKKEKKEKNGLDFTLPGYSRYDAQRRASRFEQPWVSVRNRR